MGGAGSGSEHPSAPSKQPGGWTPPSPQPAPTSLPWLRGHPSWPFVGSPFPPTPGDARRTLHPSIRGHPSHASPGLSPPHFPRGERAEPPQLPRGPAEPRAPRRRALRPGAPCPPPGLRAPAPGREGAGSPRPGSEPSPALLAQPRGPGGGGSGPGAALGRGGRSGSGLDARPAPQRPRSRQRQRPFRGAIRSGSGRGSPGSPPLRPHPPVSAGGTGGLRAEGRRGARRRLGGHGEGSGGCPPLIPQLSALLLPGGTAGAGGGRDLPVRRAARPPPRLGSAVRGSAAGWGGTGRNGAPGLEGGQPPHLGQGSARSPPAARTRLRAHLAPLPAFPPRAVAPGPPCHPRGLAAVPGAGPPGRAGRGAQLQCHLQPSAGSGQGQPFRESGRLKDGSVACCVRAT